jgi:hypothetical protein
MQPFDRTGMAATLKSADTEEFIDIYIYRPLGYLWARLFRKAGISPNTVTMLGIILGAMAGVCFYFSDIYINMAGMLLLVWANTYDSADGQLARMTGKTSEIGRLLDGLCGEVWFVCIYLAIIFRLYPEWGVWIWVLAVATGFSHSLQAAMADYYRNVHLFFIRKKSESELASSIAIEREYKRLSWKESPVMKFVRLSYMNYTAGQEKRSPRLQSLLGIIRERYDDDPPAGLREDFRMRSLPLMKYANILSFNARAIALFVGIGLNMPYLYFVFEITVLNVLLVYMVRRHEGISALFVNKLNMSNNGY